MDSIEAALAADRAREAGAASVPGARVRVRGWGWRHAGRKAWALRDIDLDIAPGERVLLLGTSGAGKSTLLGGLAGVLGGEDEGDSAGSLAVDGRAPEELRGRVGLMMQDPEAQVVLARAGDDVAFGCENLGVPREEIWTRVRDALDEVGLGGLSLDHPTSRLSGGQKQRLALASILAMRPGLLLLDEPTANLDPEGVGEVVEATRRVLERTGATLIVVEHRVDVWAGLVDRAVVVMEGAVRADGPLEDVLRDEGGALRDAGIWLPGDDRAVVEEARRRWAAASACSAPPPARGAEQAARPSPAPAMRVRDLAIGYREDRPVRSGIDLDIPRGASTCVIGPNGVGKSALALTVAGLLPQLAGTVDAAEDLAPLRSSRRPHRTRTRTAPDAARTDPHTWSSRELPGRISLVFQEPEYQFVERTVREELEVGPRLAGVGGAELDGLVERTLRRLRLDQVALANPMTLSGGEKRRLSVATALISAPRVVLLDEPTFGQDRSTWLELVGILQEAVEAGTTLVSVTHDRAFIEVMGDRVIDLSEVGRPAGHRREAEPASQTGLVPDGRPPRPVSAPPARNDPEERAAPRIGWRDVLAGRGLRAVNPVTQVLALVVMTTPLMASVDVLSAGIALALEVLLVPLAGIEARRVLTRIVPLLAAAPLAALSMLLYAKPGGDVYWSWGPAAVSQNSVELAGAVLLRVLALGLPAIVLLSRIDPTDMADGLGQVLHLPARPVLASLAGVRMTGLMVTDWRALERARRMRGIGDGSRVAAFFRGAFALLVFALRRSAKLSLTMEARGFGAPGPRSWARPSRVGGADAAMMAVAVAVPVAAIGAAVWFGVLRPAGT
ncbi:ATP-binding cassette domain-containing protein [Schaalia naturae]|uniref:ATP-binding cassette domain-containing protein n=2 Tax=Schaalia naturae TaxID=635203 RepID=A0ABW2SMW1_9ACTO